MIIIFFSSIYVFVNCIYVFGLIPIQISLNNNLILISAKGEKALLTIILFHLLEELIHESKV